MAIRMLARRVLKRAPAFIQNAYYTARGVYHLWTELGPQFRRMLTDLRESEWWDADRIRDYQDARVRELAGHAYNTVPFYREWFDAAGVRLADIRTQEHLVKLPLLTKQVVRERQRDMISRRFRGRLLTLRGTSGTTGTVVEVRQTPGCRALHRAVTFRYRGRHGIRLGDPQLRFTSQLGLLSHRDRPPFWWRNYARGQTSLSPTHLSNPRHVQVIADWLVRQHFDVFQGWPSAMLILANHLLDRSLRLAHPPRLIDYTSETLMSGAAQRLRQAFGGPAIATLYDMTEIAGVLSQCERGRLHLDFEIGCLETQPAPAGADPGLRRLIFTGWANPAMPFIRYDVGDLGMLADGPCPCGRQTPSFTAIDGRQDAYVRTPDGRTAFGLNVHLPSACEVQVRQRMIESIEVRVVPGRSYDPAEEVEMVRRLRAIVGPELRIDVVKVDAIPRSPSGKFRAVISELADRSSDQRELPDPARR